MERLTSFAIVFLVACALFFGYEGYQALFNPHIVGFVAKTGHQVRFRDNGDRFLYGVGQLAIAVAGASGAWRLIQAQRKEDADRRWSWEVTVDGQSVQRPPPSEDTIRQDMDAFDGKLAGCVLTDRDTGSRLWCYGEPERRVVEASLFGRAGSGTGVFGRDGGRSNGGRSDGATDAELVRLHAPFAVDVPASVVLTSPEALEILLAFFRGKPFPPPFALLPTAVLPGRPLESRRPTL